MIRIKRAGRPTQLSSARARRAKAKLAAIAKKGVKPRNSDFDPIWGLKPVREALWNMQGKKCCYCERYRDEVLESDIEHFRPKAGIQGVKAGGYWWLAYEWNNLFFSCR